MANSTLDSELFILYDLWPGVCWPRNIPQDFPTGSACGHNSSTAVFPVGTKIQVWNGSAGVPGWSTFIYLKLEMQDTTNVLAAKHMVAQHTDAAAGGLGIYDVTNEAASLNTDQKGPVAFGLSAMTVDYYGWFWCGGVCPEEWVSGLAGDYATYGGTVAIGPLTYATLETAGTTYGEIGLNVADGAGESVIGHALHADA